MPTKQKRTARKNFCSIAKGLPQAEPTVERIIEVNKSLRTCLAKNQARVARAFVFRRDASEGASPQRAVTERATKPEDKRAATLRAAVLAALNGVARSVEHRFRCTPSLAPCPSPQALAA